MDMDLKFFLNKLVKTWDVQDYFRQGLVVEADGEGILLEDRKEGTIFLSIHNIKSIIIVDSNGI